MAEIRKRERNGRVDYLARYRPPGSERKISKSFARRKDAADWLTTVENSKITGSYVNPNRSRVTVGAWADEWLASKLNLAPKTRERDEGIIRKHIRPTWGTHQLADVTHAEVQRWLSRLDVAPATVRKIHNVMSQILAYAVKDGRLATNHAAGVSLPRVPERDHIYLTHQQVAELAELVGPEYSLLVQFLAYTGLRWGEMAALRVRRTDFLRRRATIAESVTQIGSGLVWGPPKTHERREVPLPRFLLEDLAQHVAGKSADDLVFTGLRGNPLRPQLFQRLVLNRAAAELGEPDFTPHQFRHTAASLAIASGADVKVVQTMLGHKSATMTLDLYGHLFPDRLDVVAEAMDAARAKSLEIGHQLGTKRAPAAVVELETRR